jgi:methyl-CpG-binding domain protein 4
MARPILFAVLARYPTPEDLSSADLGDLTRMLQPIGLHNIRAMRLIAMAKAWLAAPPSRERRYRKLHYPAKGCGTDIRPKEVLGPEDERIGWEIAHLPGMGAYALDSYRIFFRDTLRGVTLSKGVEPEWKRVAADDKDLKAYLKWKWEVD